MDFWLNGVITANCDKNILYVFWIACCIHIVQTLAQTQKTVLRVLILSILLNEPKLD